MTTKVTTKRMNGFQKWKTMLLMVLLLPVGGTLMAQQGTPINSGLMGNNGTIVINSDGEYYLSENITWSSQPTNGIGIQINADVTLDLNGCVLDGKYNVQHVIQVTKGHTLTLVDSNSNTTHEGSLTNDLWVYGSGNNNPISGGVITGGKAGSPGGGGVHLPGGNLIMKNGTIAGNCTTSTSDGAGVRIQSDSNHPFFEMHGGEDLWQPCLPIGRSCLYSYYYCKFFCHDWR